MSVNTISSCALCGEAVEGTMEETDADKGEYHGEFNCRNGHEGVLEIKTPKSGTVNPTLPEQASDQAEASTTKEKASAKKG